MVGSVSENERKTIRFQRTLGYGGKVLAKQGLIGDSDSFKRVSEDE